ncbi:hypothetical protein GQ37_006400 [Janthinobacterium sp. BJB1]|nr:hypothetical protein GQ37_006400 [Janthinobacterium sp. BJB1]
MPAAHQAAVKVEVKIIQNECSEEDKDAFLRAEKILELFGNSQEVLATGGVGELESPRVRQQLYRILLERPIGPYASLIRQVFEREVQYRKALWQGEIEDDGDACEGIYRCAFLLYRVGSTSDIHALWAAKHINMDVGTSMGAEFFIGAGLQATISYLAESNLQDSNEILCYVDGWFSQDDAEEWQKDWESSMRRNISDTANS